MRNESVYSFTDRSAAGLFAPSRWRFWLVMLMAFFAVYAGRHWLLYDGFVEATRDESIFLPLILKKLDPSLYQRDFFVNNFQLASGAFLSLSAVWLKLCGGDYRLFLLGGSTAWLLIFVLGVFFLAKRITGNPVAAFLAGVLLTRPRPATAGVGFAVYLGNYQARSFVDALTPWFFLAYLRPGSSYGKLLLGTALGACSWFYPVYPAQLAGLFTLMCLMEKHPREAISVAAGFSLLFLPYYWPAITQAAGPLTEAAARVISDRWGNQVYPQVGVLMGEFCWYFSLPAAAAVLGAALTRGYAFNGCGMRSLVLAGAAAAMLIAVSFLGYFFPVFLQLMLQRMGRMYHLIFLLAGAAGAAAFFTVRKRYVLKLAYAAALLLSFGFTDPKEFVYARFGFQPAASPAVRKDELLEISRIAEERTPVDSMFLIPPEGMNNFSLYSKRGIVVSFKTPSSIRDSRVLEYWAGAYTKAREAYSGRDFLRLKKVAMEYGSDYIMIHSGSFRTGEPPEFKTKNLEVYAVPAQQASGDRR